MLRALQVFADNEKRLLTYDVGSIIKQNSLPENVDGTVLDPKVLKHGATIDLPDVFKDHLHRDIKTLTLPPVSPDGRCEKVGDLLFISPISMAMNNYLALIEQNAILKLSHVQKLIDSYFETILSRFVGSNGVLNTSVLGTRIPNSGRLVLMPQIDREPDWVGINAFAMKKANVKEGDDVIVFRDPVIWQGSIAVLRAYPIPEDVIRLHPLLFKQMGADCDGDQVAFIKLPDTMASKELRDNRLKFCKENAEWPLHLSQGFDRKPDWDNIVEDTQKRFKVTGLSYGPRDINGWNKNPTPSVAMLLKMSTKDFPSVNRTIANSSDNIDLILETNYANVYMKKNLGLVGALARKVLLHLCEDKDLRYSAGRISESIQQKTLDAKHFVGKESPVTPEDVLNIFERRGIWKNATLTECAVAMEKAGMDRKDSLDVLSYFRVILPFTICIEINFPDESTELIKELRSIVLAEDRDHSTFSVLLYPFLSKLADKLSDYTQKSWTAESFYHDVLSQYFYGITDFTEACYPGFVLSSKACDRNMDLAKILYRNVFVNQQKDRNGLFKKAFPEIRA